MQRVALVLVTATVYFGTLQFTGERVPMPGHFPAFAEAFLRGHIGVRSPARRGELIPSPDGSEFYLGYPPLPAVLLMPFVWWADGAITVQVACRVVSVLNVLLFDLCLSPLARRFGCLVA